MLDVVLSSSPSSSFTGSCVLQLVLSYVSMALPLFLVGANAEAWEQSPMANACLGGLTWLG